MPDVSKNQNLPISTRRSVALSGEAQPSSDRGRQGRIGPDATAFTAQLLAMHHGAPLYRARRRAEPGLAAAAYRAALERTDPPRPGFVLAA